MLLLEGLHEFEHFLRVARHPHAAPLAAQDSLRVDRERTALDAPHLPAIQVLHLDDAIELAGAFLRVREQIEGKFHLGLEPFVRLDAVARDAVDAAAELLELRIEIAEVLALRGAAGRVVLGVEVEHEGGARGAGEAKGFAAGCRQLEIGRWLV
jgi:hypothetical protein